MEMVAHMVGTIDTVAMHARLKPAAVALQDIRSGKTYNYRQLDLQAAKYAAELRRRGITLGDRVAALAKNRAELIFLHLACARLGAIYVPLSWRLSRAEITRVIEDAQPKLVLFDAEFSPIAVSCFALAEFATSAATASPESSKKVDSSLPSLILYTSGTSGRPKGVLLSERNLSAAAISFSVVGQVTHRSAVLCDSPMFHIIGMVTNIRPALMQGGRLVISDGFVAARTLARLSDPKLAITHYFCVPQMAAMLMADSTFDAQRLRHLTGIFSGGGPHAANAIRAWTQHGICMADGFGMSEAGTVSCMPLNLAAIDAHAGSAGFISPMVRARIVDEQGVNCSSGEPGEIVLKGPSITSGYWRCPRETAAAFTSNGWLRTGDVGRLDDDGYLWLIDRKKDMFISGGENIYPAEIEGLLAAHPAIAECALIGMKDKRWGEVGHLLMVLKPNEAADAEDIVRFLEARIARYKIPKKYTQIDQLPRNGTGKILKNTLRDKFGQPP